MVGEHPEHGQQRPGLVPDRDDEGGPSPVPSGQESEGRPAGHREDEEPGPVAVEVADVVGQDLQVEQGRRPRRQDRRGAAFAAVGDGLAGTRRVVGREQLPRTRAEECLRLTEGLDVRVHPLDVLDPLAGERGEAERDGDHDLAPDLQVELEQQVVVLADRAVDDVLDGDHAGRCAAIGDGLEHLAKASQRRPLDVAEGGDDGILGEGAGLAGVGDGQVDRPLWCHGHGPRSSNQVRTIRYRLGMPPEGPPVACGAPRRLRPSCRRTATRVSAAVRGPPAGRRHPARCYGVSWLIRVDQLPSAARVPTAPGERRAGAKQVVAAAAPKNGPPHVV